MLLPTMTYGTTKLDLLDGLPGEPLIRQGLADHSAQIQSVESCLVDIASPHLRRAGISPLPPESPNSELTLYSLLRKSPGDAYPRYNALLRELVSFEHALDHRVSRAQKAEKTE